LELDLGEIELSFKEDEEEELLLISNTPSKKITSPSVNN
jgi:hypothetical protein